MTRVDVGQRDRHDPATIGRDLGFDRIEELFARVTRVDHDHLATADEDGVGRSTGGPERALAGHHPQARLDPLDLDRRLRARARPA